MDVLSDIINDSGWKGDLLSRTNFYKSWGLKFPCEKSAGFHIVNQGKCFVKFKNKKLLLNKGDILFISKGINHELVSDLNQRALDIQEFRKLKQKQLETKIPITSFLSVRYEIGNKPLHPFFLELPEIILVKADEIPNHHPLQTTLVLISQEIDRGIGSDILLQKLSDILLYNVIRHWLEKNQNSKKGWLSALKDEKILAALEAIHLHSSHPWTLDSLARRIGISRASLATRFKILGCTPMDYLAKLRIEKGKQLLIEENTSLEDVARKVGYSTAFAFSKAYKRIKGVSPKFDKIQNYKIAS